MSNLKEILESLEKLKTKYIIARDYERAVKVREVIKLIINKLKQMDTFLDRLEEEQEILLDKVVKLEDFIDNNSVFLTVSEMQRVLLVTQLNAMKLYLYTLQERIYDLLRTTNN